MSNKSPTPTKKIPLPPPEELSRATVYPVDVDTSKIIVPFMGRFEKGTYRKGYGTHTGIDFIGNDKKRGLGKPVYAVADGVVTNSSSPLSLFGYGNMVILRHPQFRNDTASRYAHLQKRAVRVGQSVRRGQVIGYVGKSATDNVHLHFDIIDHALPSDRYFPRPGGFSDAQVRAHFRDPLEFFKTTGAVNLGDA
jgi:murein DD-endopeptidase MepM/ murein hydrolase activator NlpD